MLVLRLRPLAFATFLVWRLRTGACGFWRLRQLPIIYNGEDKTLLKNCKGFHVRLYHGREKGTISLISLGSPQNCPKERPSKSA